MGRLEDIKFGVMDSRYFILDTRNLMLDSRYLLEFVIWILGFRKSVDVWVYDVILDSVCLILDT